MMQTAPESFVTPQNCYSLVSVFHSYSCSAEGGLFMRALLNVHIKDIVLYICHEESPPFCGGGFMYIHLLDKNKLQNNFVLANDSQ